MNEIKWINIYGVSCGITTNITELSQSGKVRLACFDLDDTLIFKTRGKDDEPDVWTIIPEIISKIVDLIKNSYLIIIFTNQSSLKSIMKSGGKKMDNFKKNCNMLINEIYKKLKDYEYYFGIYIAKENDYYRKSNIG